MECGGCTLCCYLLPVRWLKKPMNTHCKHECEKGCDIQDTKPDDCRNFNCAYVQMEKAKLGLRPDRCGVVFEKISDELFLGTCSISLLDFNDLVKGQINSFISQGISVVLINNINKELMVCPTEGTSREKVWENLQNKVRERYDTAIVHD